MFAHFGPNLQFPCDQHVSMPPCALYMNIKFVVARGASHPLSIVKLVEFRVRKMGVQPLQSTCRHSRPMPPGRG